MTLFAMGQATKTGIEVRGDDKSKIKCKSRKVGNMNMPDPQDLEEKFFSDLAPTDTVVSPSGANYTFLVGAYVRTGHVFWIDPGTLAEKMENGLKGKSTCVALLELFQKEPDLFYEYKPTNAKLAQLLMAVRNWLNLEQQCTADGNAYAQYLRRERDLTTFQKPDRIAWVTREVEREIKKVEARVKSAGIKLTKEQQKEMRRGLAKEYGKRFDSYFNASAKDAATVQKKLIEERMAWFGVDELEADAETRVRDLLNEMPESKLFDGLLGEGAIKTRGEVLAFIRNPLFYDVFAQLEHYAGIGKLDGGQAQRRVHGVRLVGRPEFRKALCFDFGEKYWQCDTIGFFKALYYGYKRHQVLRYWPLMQITSDVWKLFGKAPADEDADEMEVDDATDEELQGKPEEADSIRDIARRLEAISHLPVIGRNPDVMRAIVSLQKEPDKKLLWKLFSKGSGGYNLQMPPKRIERQTKRMLGSVLLQTVYYRWLKLLGEPLPLAQDYKYVAQYRHVTGDAKAIPTEFDHELVLKYFVKIGDELEQAADLPVEAAIKLVMPDKRADYLNKLPLDARVRALCALTDKDCAAFALGLKTNADRDRLFGMFPSNRRDKVQEVMAEMQAKAKEAAKKTAERQAQAADKAEATASKKRAKDNGKPVELSVSLADAE